MRVTADLNRSSRETLVVKLVSIGKHNSREHMQGTSVVTVISEDSLRRGKSGQDLKAVGC